jgi:penicillin-binding protein 2
MHTPSESDRHNLFTRRALLIGGLKLGVFGLIAGRLYQLQVLESTKYQTMAEENRMSQRLLVPLRGQIKDRNGVLLALNQANFRLIIDPSDSDDMDVLLQKLGQLVTLTSSDYKRIDRDIEQGNTSNGVLISDNITWEQAATIELHYPDLHGSRIEQGAVRAYPYGTATAHLLGYAGTPSEKDSKREPLFSAPGFKIGKSGMEQQLDEELRGTAGHRQLEVDAHGKIVRELDQIPATSGKEITLSLDIGLQQFVQQRLAQEESAAAVIMDAHNGCVYALASSPSFDANLFTFGIGQKDWDKLNNDPHTPLSNKAISGQYSPGSTFKIVTSLAALDAGVIKENDTVFCPGHLDLGNHRFHCWKKGGHGTVNIISAMAGSCDTYFYDISQRVGIDRIQAMANRLGLGARTGIDLPHERSGFIPSRQWKLATQKEEWQLGETLINAIGQGFVLATPIQLAMMSARIANGGYNVLPTLIKPPVTAPRGTSLGLQARHLEIVTRAITGVVNSPIGTAYSERIQEPQWAMAGKTGTSQVRRISKAEHDSGVIKNEKLPWEQRDHALFTGFAPISNPRYAFAVVIEHGGSGAHVAAPLAHDIMVECQKRNVAS